MKFLGIDIEVIPHELQRYPTCGDWQWSPVEQMGPDKKVNLLGEKLQINISDTDNNWSNFLIMIHEIVEAMLCAFYNIPEKDVDEWDLEHLEDKDPGSLPGCPYLLPHTIATSIECLLCCALFISWTDHCRRIELLDKDVEYASEINGTNI